MTETINQSEYVKQLEDTIEVIKNGQVDYIKSLEETNELMTQNLENGVKGYWFDRHVDNVKSKPVVRSDLRIFGVCVAYVVLKDDKWSVFFLRREETKNFSGYRFCRLEGSKNKPDKGHGVFDDVGLEHAKGLALRAVR